MARAASADFSQSTIQYTMFLGCFVTPSPEEPQPFCFILFGFVNVCTSTTAAQPNPNISARPTSCRQKP